MITMSRVAADELEVQTPKSKLKIWIVEHNILFTYHSFASQFHVLAYPASTLLFPLMLRALS
jgi:hypothetical protein